MKKYKLIIFDADDTLRFCTVPGQPCPNKPGEWKLLPKVKEKLAEFDWGSPLEGKIAYGIASNQGGVGVGYFSAEMAYQLLKEKPSTGKIEQAWKMMGMRGYTHSFRNLDWSEKKILVWNHFFHAEYLRMINAPKSEITEYYDLASKSAGTLREMHHNLGSMFHRLGRMDLLQQQQVFREAPGG